MHRVPVRLRFAARLFAVAAFVSTSICTSCASDEATIADDASPRLVSTAGLTFESSQPLVAGSSIVADSPLVVVYTPGIALAPGSLIAIAFPTAVQEESGDLWSIPTTEAGLPGSCRLDERSSAHATIVTAGRARGGAGRILVRASRRVEAGESIRILLTGQVPKIVPKQTFRVVDLDAATGSLARVPDDNQQIPPVVAGRAVRVLATLPSDAGARESVRLRLVAVDGFGNVDASYRGPVMLSGPLEGLPSTVEFGSDDRGIRVLEGLVSSRVGVARVSLSAPVASGESSVASNPMQVWAGTPPMRRFAGDAHFHSGSDVASVATDGGDHRGQFVRSADAFAFLRDVAGADWGISAEHDTGLSESSWHENQRRVSEIDAPGRFVALAGYEWTPPRRLGHHVIVFESAADAGNTLVGASSGRRGGDGAASIDELVAALRPTSSAGHRLLLIPHVMQPFPNADDDREGHEKTHEIWDGPSGSAPGTYVANDLRRVGEIYSHHNDDFTVDGYRQTREGRGDAVNQPQLFELGTTNSWSYQHAWATGHRIGVIGGSDNHFGTPGLNDFAPTVPHHAGLAMVFAPRLEREAVFAALYDRRCYATTGARILLDVSVDGLTMGSEATRATGARLPISVTVSGTAAIAAIEVLKLEGDAFVVLPGRLTRSGEMDATVAVDDMVTASTLYYVRVQQADGEWAWTSPVWIDVLPSAP